MSDRRLFVLGRLARRWVRAKAILGRVEGIAGRLCHEEHEEFEALKVLHWLLRQLRRKP